MYNALYSSIKIQESDTKKEAISINCAPARIQTGYLLMKSPNLSLEQTVLDNTDITKK
jgi:hypothetical protein